MIKMMITKTDPPDKQGLDTHGILLQGHVDFSRVSLAHHKEDSPSTLNCQQTVRHEGDSSSIYSTIVYFNLIYSVYLKQTTLEQFGSIIRVPVFIAIKVRSGRTRFSSDGFSNNPVASSNHVVDDETRVLVYSTNNSKVLVNFRWSIPSSFYCLIPMINQTARGGDSVSSTMTRNNSVWIFSTELMFKGYIILVISMNKEKNHVNIRKIISSSIYCLTPSTYQAARSQIRKFSMGFITFNKNKLLAISYNSSRDAELKDLQERVNGVKSTDLRVSGNSFRVSSAKKYWNIWFNQISSNQALLGLSVLIFIFQINMQERAQSTVLIACDLNIHNSSIWTEYYMIQQLYHENVVSYLLPLTPAHGLVGKVRKLLYITERTRILVVKIKNIIIFNGNTRDIKASARWDDTRFAWNFQSRGTKRWTIYTDWSKHDVAASHVAMDNHNIIALCQTDGKRTHSKAAESNGHDLFFGLPDLDNWFNFRVSWACPWDAWFL